MAGTDRDAPRGVGGVAEGAEELTIELTENETRRAGGRRKDDAPEAGRAAGRAADAARWRAAG